MDFMVTSSHFFIWRIKSHLSDPTCWNTAGCRGLAKGHRPRDIPHIVHSMRKEPFDQFVRARGTGTICKVEGAIREWESDLKGLGSNQRPGACFTKTVLSENVGVYFLKILIET